MLLYITEVNQTTSDRIIKALDLARRSKSDLARHMGVHPNGMTQQLKKETNSLRLVLACHELTGVDMYWLSTGKGEMFREIKGIDMEQIKNLARKEAQITAKKEAKAEWLKQAKKLFGGEEDQDT